MSDTSFRRFSPRLLWDGLILTDAEQRVTAYPLGSQDARRTLLRAAGERSRVADDLVDGHVASAFALYREAALLHMAAFVTTRADIVLPTPLRADDVSAAFMQAIDGRPVALDRAQLQLFLSRSQDPDLLAIDRLDEAAANQLGRETQGLVKDLARLVDPRTVAEVVFERRLRLGGAALALVLVLAWTASAVVARRNLALHRPVTTSGSHPTATSTPEGLTDGVTSGSYGVHTAVSDNPWVQVDLLAVHQIDRVKIYNRGDGWFDDGLPMTLQLSENGVTFVDVETRSTTFTQKAPWVAKAGGRKARYVRIKGTKGKYVTLSEVEVFGSKR